MKKLLLFGISAILTINTFGQVLSPAISTGAYKPLQTTPFLAAAKTTGVVHDSLVLSNLPATGDTNTLYTISHSGLFNDSGYLAGTNGFGYSGFAERYDFNSADSTVKVLGVLALFGGTVNPATTKTVTFKIWSPAAAIMARPTLTFSGFPGTVLDSAIVSIKNLGIASVDTYKAYYFAAPTAYLSTSFFAGYTINYNFSTLSGDTIGLQTSRLGERLSAEYTVAGGDTTVNDQNAVFDTSLWLDVEANLGFKLDFYIFPIVDVKWSTTSVGVTKNDLTIFGNYPNPAVNSTNIRFSLGKSTDVTIMITDMNGRAVNTIIENNLSAGEHMVTVGTANLPTGNYLYAIRTADGNGIASKLTIVK